MFEMQERPLPGSITALLSQPPARVPRTATCAIDLPVAGGKVGDGPHLEILERCSDGALTLLEVKPCSVQHESAKPRTWGVYLLWPVPLHYDRDVTIGRVLLHMPNWKDKDGRSFAAQEMWASAMPQFVPAGTNFVLL